MFPGSPSRRHRGKGEEIKTRGEWAGASERWTAGRQSTDENRHGWGKEMHDQFSELNFLEMPLILT